MPDYFAFDDPHCAADAVGGNTMLRDPVQCDWDIRERRVDRPRLQSRTITRPKAAKRALKGRSFALFVTIEKP